MKTHPALSLLPLLLIAFVALSCHDTDNPDTIINSSNSQKYRVLKITIKKVVSQSPYTEAPVANAQIKLYRTEADRDSKKNEMHSSLSNSQGLAEIGGLLEEDYYVRIIHSLYGELHPKLHTPKSALVNFETQVYP